MLTLRDRLSRLTYKKAVKLLGKRGESLLRAGGKYEIDVYSQIEMSRDSFRLHLPDCTVSIVDDSFAEGKMRLICSDCNHYCEHMGALVSTVLEQKSELEFSIPAADEVEHSTLTEEELVERELKRREDRAERERMVVRTSDKSNPWCDYIVTSKETGKSYRVAIRGLERGQGFCTCPDFRKNTLGICKHILRVNKRVREKFTSQKLSRPFIPAHFAVYLSYDKELSLYLQAPPKVSERENRLFSSWLKSTTPIHNVPVFLKAVKQHLAGGGDILIYPDAERYINEVMHSIKMDKLVSEMRKKKKTHPLRKTLLKTELLPYQLDGIAFAAGAGRAVLADDMGLGKTIQAIGVSELLFRECSIRRVLVVCPTSLKSQWRNEIHRFCDKSVELVIGSALERQEQYTNSAFFTVCNYEQVLRDIQYIERNQWDLIILDEGQRIKNWESKTSQTIKALRSPYALVLSGTPLENRLEELYSVIEFIDDRRLGPDFRFQHSHKLVDIYGKPVGYRNLEKLRKTIKPLLLRRTRSEVMRQLPSRTIDTIRITPTEEQLDINNAQMKIVANIVSKQHLREVDLLRMQKALLAARMAADSTYLNTKSHPSYSSKLERLTELLPRLVKEKGRKTIVFSEWTTMLDLIEPILKKSKISFVRLDGSVPQKKRQAIVSSFNTDENVRFFLTTNAGSTGLNLQAANTIVNVDLPWNPAILEQRIARAHRMGQEKPVYVYLLVTENTLEERMLSTLAAKHDLSLAALDASSTVDTVELSSGIDELKKRLERFLGQAPEAPADKSSQLEVEEEVQCLQKRQRIEQAGGQIITGALSLLNEIIPVPDLPETYRNKVADSIIKNLRQSVQQDEQGNDYLKLSLPGRDGLEQIGQALTNLALLTKNAQ